MHLRVVLRSFFFFFFGCLLWTEFSGGCARECENAGEWYAAWWNLALFEVPCVMRTGGNDQIFQSGFSFRLLFFWFGGSRGERYRRL